jgi:hypothetical protein
MKQLALMLFIVAVVTSACQRYAETYAVTFRSKAGIVLAAGTIRSRTPLPATGKIRAIYKLKIALPEKPEKEVEWFSRLFRDRNEGEVDWLMQPDQPDDWQYAFNFMPGMADANIVANSPRLKEGRTTGVWLYAIEAGGYHGGSFELEKK